MTSAFSYLEDQLHAKYSNCKKLTHIFTHVALITTTLLTSALVLGSVFAFLGDADTTQTISPFQTHMQDTSRSIGIRSMEDVTEQLNIIMKLDPRLTWIIQAAMLRGMQLNHNNAQLNENSNEPDSSALPTPFPHAIVEGELIPKAMNTRPPAPRRWKPALKRRK